MYTKEQLIEFAKKHWDAIASVELDHSSPEALVNELWVDTKGDDLAVMDRLEDDAYWNDDDRCAKHELILSCSD